MDLILLSLVGLIIVQQAYLIVIERRYERERSNLLDRIMSKDIADYQALQGIPPSSKSRNTLKKAQIQELKDNGIFKE